MARPLRIQFPGAVYHVTSRGDEQADIVRNDDDRQRWRQGLSITVIRHGWELLSYVLMDNHFHLFVRTPEANLACGMQAFLSGYATWFSRRRGGRGHVFQGRYDSRLVEGSSYYWTVSRYVHLNPVRAGMVARAGDWPWSSFRGFVEPTLRVPWMAYDSVLRAWRGDFGGTAHDAPGSYGRFVDSVDGRSLTSPFDEAVDGWILGGDTFVERMRALAAEVRPIPDPEVPDDVRLRRFDLERVVRAVCERWGVAPSALTSRRNRDARLAFASVAALHTSATRAEIGHRLGLTRPQSVAALLARARPGVTSPERPVDQVESIVRELRSDARPVPDDGATGSDR